MNQPPDHDLESFVHRELRRLPEVPAPDGLIPAVWERIRRRRPLPWWRRSLWQWPAPARSTALCVFAVCGLALTWGAASFGGSIAYLETTLQAQLRPWETLWNTFVYSQTWLQSFTANAWVLAASAFIASVYLLLLGAASVLFRFGCSRTADR